MNLWSGKIDWIKYQQARDTVSTKLKVLPIDCLIDYVRKRKPRLHQGVLYNAPNHSQAFEGTDFSLGNNGKTPQEVMSARSYETFVVLNTWTKFIREELAVFSPTSRLPFLLVMPENPKKWRRKLTYKWISVRKA